MPKSNMQCRAAASAVTIIALSIGSPAATAAEEPLILQPTSKWQLDYADDSCRLARKFGEGEQTIFVIMDRYEPGDYFSLILSGEPFDGAVSSGQADVRFGPAEEEVERFFSGGDLGEDPALIFGSMLISQDNIEVQASSEAMKDGSKDITEAVGPEGLVSAAREEQVRFLQVDARGIDPVRLETGSLAKPMQALDTCMDELLTHWGIDVARHEKITRPATPSNNPGSWVTHRDYPKDLLRKGAQGLVHFRLSVDEKGKVTDCHIQSSTRPEGFDMAVCEAITRRAEFDPALDADGRPMASYFINSVRFEIPG